MGEEQAGLRWRSPTGVEGLEAASGTKSSGGASGVCARDVRLHQEGPGRGHPQDGVS